MLTQHAKELFSRLEMEYPAVAVKFSYQKPEGVGRAQEQLSFCQFLKKAQTEGEKFYITADNDNCSGKVTLGMVPRDPFTVSGVVGRDFELYRDCSPNIRIHNSYPVVSPGSIRYVEFCPVELCDFSPDLLICVTGLRQAEIIMRATSYISGDLWESRSSCVVSCAWTYAYPYLSGKVNFCITGMHHGMKRREVYPEGLHIISIPYQKLDEVVTALDEMPWVPIAMRGDPESKALLSKRMEAWGETIPTLEHE